MLVYRAAMVQYTAFRIGAAAVARALRLHPGPGKQATAGLLAALALLTGFPGHSTAGNLTPDQLVGKVLSEVLAAVEDAPIDGKNREHALAIAKQKILPHIDFEMMTRLAVGRAWRSASAGQRQLLVTEFGTFITRIYSFAIDAYHGQEAVVETLNLDPADDDVTVRTRFEQSGAQPVQVDYAMRKSPEGWKVYDIVVEHVSLVLTYRSQFNEELQRSGIDGLVRTLAEKNRSAQGAR